MIPDHETYAYSASKAGLHHLSRTMGGRLGWEGITSNTIACGQYSSFRSIYSLLNAWICWSSRSIPKQKFVANLNAPTFHGSSCTESFVI